MPLVLVVEEVTEEERPLGLLQVPGVILCEIDRLSNCDFYLELRPEGCPDFNKEIWQGKECAVLLSIC